MPVGQHIATVQPLQNLKRLHGQRRTPASACEPGHCALHTVRYTPGALALSACHAASCSSSTFKSHWPLPTTLRMLGDSLYHLRIEKYGGMQASSAFTGTRKY